MKQLIQFKNIFIYSVFGVIVAFATSSCNNAPKAEDTKERAEDHNEAKFNTKSTEKDAQFLVNAAEINLEEIKLGQLAQQKAMMADVKSLGKMMEDGHTKAMADLTAMAKTKNITIPTMATDKANDAYKKLNDEKANKFDKEYCDMMVDGHKDAVSKFEEMSKEATDPDIKQWAMSMLPDLRTHLDHSLMCQTKASKMK